MPFHTSEARQRRKEDIHNIVSKGKSIVQSTRDSITAKLEEREANNRLKQDRDLTRKENLLVRNEELNARKLAIAKRDATIRKEQEVLQTVKREGQKPSIITTLVRKTLVGKPVKVMKKGKVKSKVKCKERKIIKKGKSKIKI